MQLNKISRGEIKIIGRDPKDLVGMDTNIGWNATQQDFTCVDWLNISRFSVCILGKSSILENSILPDSYAMFVYTF